MKKIIVAVFAICLLVNFTPSQPQKVAAELVWETNFEAAVKKAKKAKKKLLLNFTGSDWCGWCIRLDKEVFSKDAFIEYANQNLVCVKLDFPKAKKLPKEEKAQNKALAVVYKDHFEGSYPTILIINATKDVIFKTGYIEGGAKPYIEHLEQAIGKAKPTKKK